MSPELPIIPDQGLVFRPDDYKVVANYDTTVTIYGRDKLATEEASVALVMPKVPGKGDFTTGFDMTLIKILDNGELSKSAADYMTIKSGGGSGFIVSGTGFTGIYLDNERSIKEHTKLGYGPSIRKLRKSVKKHRRILKNRRALQAEWEYAALDITPALARFFVLIPDEKPQTPFVGIC